MKLPSLDYIITQSRSTLLRFPFVLASAALASGIAVYLIALPYQQTEEVSFLYNAILVLVLGISLFTGLTLIGEKNDWNPAIFNGIGALILLGYYLILPSNLDDAPSKHLLRYMLYFLAVHLMVAVGPFWSDQKMTGFWQYNKTLFLRFLTAALFSTVLFIGLSVALSSIDVLFGIDIGGDIYLQLFTLIAGLFNTWFFLAGIPKSLDKLEHMKAYPRGLKVFTQYILIPLVSVYLVILYCYTGKIILEWSWPEGWVAYLVLSFSIVGIFALLLLYPIRGNVGNRWIKQFSRNYFRSLVPLVILLLLAIWVRIDEYSFTVNRYFVLILGIWLAGIIGYFILSKAQNIKVIPASLGIVALLISFGPWGAFFIAEQSQVNRLQQYLQQNKILKEGRIHKASASVPREDRREISSILRYLNGMHGLDGIQPWFEEDLSSLTSDTDSTQAVPSYDRPEYVAKLMGIDYSLTPPDHADIEASSRHFSAKNNRLVDIQQYSWLAKNIRIQPRQPTDSLQIETDTFMVSLADDSLNLRFSLKGQSQPKLTLPVERLADTLLQHSSSANYGLPPEQMTVVASNGQWQVKVYFRNLSLQETKDRPYLESAQLDLLLKTIQNE